MTFAAQKYLFERPGRSHPISGCDAMPTGDETALISNALRARRKAA
jgi:hypothetical protein